MVIRYRVVEWAILLSVVLASVLYDLIVLKDCFAPNLKKKNLH